MFFGYSVRSPHRTAKPSRGCLRVVGLKAHADLSPCNTPPRREPKAPPGVSEAPHARTTPPAELWFFVNNFSSAPFTWGETRRCLQTNHTKPPPAGFGGAVRRSRAIAPKTCLFVRFFTSSQNIKMTPFSFISKVYGHV